MTASAAGARANCSAASGWLLFALVLVCYGYFYNGSGWSQNARYDAIFAFVEPGHEEFLSFRIDRFLVDPDRGINTGDWSFYEGHYYSNKAPGPILLGVPLYAVLYGSERLLGVDPGGELVEIFNLYLINLVLSGLASAFALMLFFRVLAAGPGGISAALSVVIPLAFGSMLFPYSTQFWGHSTACAALIGALAVVVALRRGGISAGGCRRLHGALGALVGVAVLCDYLAGLSAVTLGLYILVVDRRRLGWYILGGLIPGLVFAAYHWACFGSPLALATDYVNPIFNEEGSLFGHFTWGRLWALLASRYRGILLHMPWLTVSLAGLVLWFCRARRDPLLWLCVVSIVGSLWVNASFNGWHGGSTVSARYQIIALPFWALSLGELPGVWRRLRLLRVSLLVSTGVSLLNMLVIAAVSPTSPYARPEGPAEYYDPLYGWAYRMFLSGHLSPHKFSLSSDGFVPWRACNAGDLLGLHGLPSLIPLVLVGAALAGALLWSARRALSCPPCGAGPTAPDPPG